MNIIKKIYSIINYPRSIFPLLYFFTLKDKKNIIGDIKRYVEDNREESIYTQLHNLLLNNKTFRNIFYYRLRKNNKIMSKLLQFFYPPMKSIEISGDIEPGLVIYHGYSTIIHATKIGENFSTYQNVTIGRGNNINERYTPIIGDNVVVYTGAVVLGGITIGDNVKIGAGSVVIKDVPSNCVVAGNPAKVVKYLSKEVRKNV